MFSTKVALPQSPTGILGLDKITNGGLPKGRPTFVCGDVLNPNLTVTVCCGRKYLMLFKAFSSDISLRPPPVPSSSIASAQEIYPAPRSLNLMAIFAFAMKKRLISGLKGRSIACQSQELAFIRQAEGETSNGDQRRSAPRGYEIMDDKINVEGKHEQLFDQEQIYNLRLYVAGQTPKSLTALANLKKICEEHLAGKFHLEVIDLLENPQLAQGDQILAIPTLVRNLPAPLRKIIGDLSNTEKVLVGLDLCSAQ